MLVYYFDASSLVKYYVAEVGSQWVKAVIDSPQSIIATSLVTGAEAPAALTKKRRQKEISRRQLEAAREAFENHWLHRYVRLSVAHDVIVKARDLIYHYPLRGYDAIQLASACLFDQTCRKTGFGPAVFVAADVRLLTVASGQGLIIENPK